MSLSHGSQPHRAAPAAADLGTLRGLGYRSRTVKQELRENTLARIRDGLPLFPGIIGYDETVVPQVVAGLLSRHDLLLLGLRGQAKTRILRAMTGLLDEWMPIIATPHGGEFGVVELRDDPLAPRTHAGRRVVESMGDRTPIAWVHRSERYVEKLATPDVTIADLIGEIDLVKYAAGRSMADETTMHFGLIPRASRGIFVINELPDLSPRIQVGLFNVLEERDVQIRGYALRLDLDVCLMFSANPEDYTNRGRIVTPLKDRIGSVVRTHYPTDHREAMRITMENAFVERGPEGSRVPGSGTRVPEDPATRVVAPPGTRDPDPGTRFSPPLVPTVTLPPILHEIIEETVRLARRSSHINQASGVSVRASITAVENAVSSAEARAARTGEERVSVRPCDLAMVIPALRGKIELMLADDGAGGGGAGKDVRSTEDRLIEALVGEATKAVIGRKVGVEPFVPVAEAFKGGLRLELGDTASAADVVASMKLVPGLVEAAGQLGKTLGMDTKDEQARACCGELVLEYLYVNNRLSKKAGAYTK